MIPLNDTKCLQKDAFQARRNEWELYALTLLNTKSEINGFRLLRCKGKIDLIDTMSCNKKLASMFIP